MNVGLPGLGLGGLFYLLGSLLGPVVEVARTRRGLSTPASRRVAASHFGIAVAMLVALDLTVRAVSLVFLADSQSATGAVGLPIEALAGGLALLLLLLGAVQLAALGQGYRAAWRRRRGASLPVPAAVPVPETPASR